MGDVVQCIGYSLVRVSDTKSQFNDHALQAAGVLGFVGAYLVYLLYGELAPGVGTGAIGIITSPKFQLVALCGVFGLVGLLFGLAITTSFAVDALDDAGNDLVNVVASDFL